MLIKMQHFPGSAGPGSAGIPACMVAREEAAGMPALPGTLTDKRPQNTPQREDLAWIDGLVDDARDQLLQESAAANATCDEVIEQGAREPVLSDSIAEELRLQFAPYAVRKFAQPVQVTRCESLVSDFGGDLARLHRLADALAGKRKRRPNAFSQHENIAGTMRASSA